MTTFQLDAKLIIKGEIECRTGLHIGGSTSALDIGGIDNAVIKDAYGIPYIPGSSLKGKIRSLLEQDRAEDTNCKKRDEKTQIIIDPNCIITKAFGKGAEKDSNDVIGPTRFYFRDAKLIRDSIKDFSHLELDYTEAKWENTINRINSSANPRQIERVPAGTRFEFEILVNFYKEIKSPEDNKSQTTNNEREALFNLLKEGLLLLEDDYLGGSGSRGYGKVKFFIKEAYLKDSYFYRQANSNGLQNILINQDQDIEKAFTKIEQDLLHNKQES